jgi:hypothetical protein
MRIVVVNVDQKRWRRIRQYWENRNYTPKRFPGTEGSIPDTYRRLCEKALEEGWDEETVVVQDDVWFRDGIPRHDGELTVYGTQRDWDHTCPHAFSATPLAWIELASVWDGTDDGLPHPTCRAFAEVVDELGSVLNVVEHGVG